MYKMKRINKGKEKRYSYKDRERDTGKRRESSTCSRYIET